MFHKCNNAVKTFPHIIHAVYLKNRRKTLSNLIEILSKAIDKKKVDNYTLNVYVAVLGRNETLFSCVF